MNQLSVYITGFFHDMVIGADAGGEHSYKDFLESAVERFLRNENKETAYHIYEVFFNLYAHTTGNEGVSFVRLLEKLKGYEENAAVLTKKQRDHFVHSINVFLLGIAIYQSNEPFRELFNQKRYEKRDYKGKHKTAGEEFFYRWGLAALCHDIGYPVEIINNQINDFINFTHQLRTEDKHINVRVEYDSFELLNTIPEQIAKRKFINSYYNDHESSVYVDLLKPVDLLAHELHMTLDVDLLKVKERLDHYISESSKSGHVDHGFFSAIILLKWYGYMIQISNCSPDQLYYPVLDSASGILLHNFYGIALMRRTNDPKFELGPLDPASHPIAYLLILCDELQEWNREPYGELDKMRAAISKATILLDSGMLNVAYIVDQGTMPEEFVGKKINTLNSLLKIHEIFPGGLFVGCEAVSELPPLNAEVPPLLLGKLEQLAIAIHDRYNNTTRKLHPEDVIKYPRFSDLPKDKKFFNLRSALDFPEEVAAVDCEIRTLDGGDPTLRVLRFTTEEVEVLACYEHERWMRSRAERGWKYGKTKDHGKKLNPHMVPYEQLEEDVKEYDRDPARNLPQLLEAIGLGIYRKGKERIERFTDEQIEILAREIHSRYMNRWEKNHPGEKAETFETLSDEKRESNRRQARGIPNKLRHLNCEMLPIGTEEHGPPITAFPVEMIEFLAKIEHDEWAGEKVQNGWSYAPLRDEDLKYNEFLVSYDYLEESIKEYDRDTVRSIPELVKACGYAIFKGEN